MKREDLELNRVYTCTTRLPDRTELVFGRRYSVGLCRVVEIPPSGREILVKQVNSRLEPKGMSLAVPLQDIRIAGEADIEAAIRETRVATSAICDRCQEAQR